jgi:hypothetical protein
MKTNEKIILIDTAIKLLYVFMGFQIVILGLSIFNLFIR